MFALFIFLLMFLFFWIRGAIFLDPDFGWHLKSGELMLKEGIPAADPFSYTMPSFPFINHEWLTDIGIALLYPRIGMVGLALLASLGIVGTLYILIRNELRPWTFIPLLLTSSSLIMLSGVRPQIISWVFISLLALIIFDKNRLAKWRWFLPFLFLIWANLHGGFVAGIAILVVAVLTRSIEQRKIHRADIALLAFSVIATFINPYGVHLWERIILEMWRQATDPQLRYVIMEWRSSLFHLDPALWILITISTFLTYRYRKKFSRSELTVFILLLLFSLSSIRHVPLWVVIQLPFLNRALGNLNKEALRYKEGKKRFSIANRIVLLAVFFLFIFEGMWALKQAWDLSEFTFYPKSAVAYLKIHPSSGQLFSYYGWGGYLIWKYPSKKLFIDGRMPSWKTDYAPPNESKNAFLEYKELFAGKIPFDQAIEKYHIDTVLFSITELYQPPACLTNIQTTLNCMMGAKKEKEESPFIQRMKNNRMKKVYQDSTAVIYQRTTTQNSSVPSKYPLDK